MTKVKIQKFNFGNRFETLETNDLSVAVKSLKDYRYCGGHLYMSTRFVGIYAFIEYLE